MISLAEEMRQAPPAAALESNDGPPFSPIRSRSSRPGAPVSVYLDFDGEAAFDWHAGQTFRVNGPGGPDVPVPNFSIDNLPGYTTAELDGMDAIWAQVAEKFSPFNINVTTVRPAGFGEAEAVHMIIGGSRNDWYMQNVGGVAPYEGFTRSERSNEGFVFSADAIAAGSVTLSEGNRHYLAETVAHEAGHLFALEHQSLFNGANVSVEYSTGNAIEVPIMGGSSNTRTTRGTWWNGPTSKRDANNNIVAAGQQDDLARITRPGMNIHYRVDDYGTFSGSGALTVDSQSGLATGYGVIERVGDQDAFTFTATGPVLSFTVNQFQSLIPGGVPATMVSGMLAPTLELIPISGNAPAVSLTTNNTSATLTASNVTPGQGFVLRVSPQGNAYGNLGQYFITGNLGTFASMNNGTLVVNGYNAPNEINISYHAGSNEIVLQNDVFGGSAVQRFPRAGVTGILVNGQSAADTIDIFGQISSQNLRITVNGGGGIDTLILQGTTGNDYQALTAGRGFVSNSVFGNYNSVENAILTGFDGADRFELFETAVGLATTLYGGGHDDVLTVGASSFASTLVQGAVAAFGDAGDDVLNIGSDNGDALFANISFNGGTSAGAAGDRIVINDTAPSYRVNYDVSSTGINRDGFNAPQLTSYFNVDGIVIHCGSGSDNVYVRNGVTANVTANGNGGSDNFVRGGGNLTGASPSLFNGGPGTDRITFDDHLATGNVIFDIRENEVVYGGLLTQSTAGFESVGILAGTGNNEITFFGTLTQEFNVDAGGGSDTLIFGFNGRAQFYRPVTVSGGTGNDNFFFRSGTSNWSNYETLGGSPLLGIAPITIDGGAGFNTLSVDDAARTNARYAMTDTRLTSYEGDFLTFGADLVYDNVNALSVSTSAGANQLTVYGVSSDIDAGNQVTFSLGEGSDVAWIYPRNAAGELTINGNLGIIGGNGVDTLTIEDAASTLPIDYVFANPFGGGTQNVFGLGSRGGLGTATLENVRINAGSGNDTFAMNQFKSGVGVTILAGEGDDVLSMGNGNIAANVTSLGPCTFDGQGGYDTFNVVNDAAGSTAYRYSREADFFRIGGIATTPGFRVQDPNVELTDLRAGGGAAIEYMEVLAMRPGTELRADMGTGTDVLRLGFSGILASSNTLDNIQGIVRYTGGAAGGRIDAEDSADTTGDVFHLTTTSLGAAPGDTLFGAGGALYFTNIVDVSPTALALVLNCGSGDDTAYAQPLATGTALINLGTQAAARASGDDAGDALFLALANTPDYVVDDADPTAGSVTGTGTGTLAWTGLDQPLAIDDAAPSALAGSYLFDTALPALSVSFSENVAATFGTASITLVNVATGEAVYTGDFTVAYDASTDTANVTFPNRSLPDGTYEVTIQPGYADAFGNAASGPLTFDFFVLAGDANQDRKVDFDDLLILAQNYGQAGRTFSQGNFDYSDDGLVGFDDLLMLAQRYGASLATVANAVAAASSPPAASRTPRRRSTAVEVL